MATSSKVKHVVADSGAFIRNAPLREIGEKIYTLREVVREIRDNATRQRLQVLPYQLDFRVPSSDSIRIVTEFSKKTGDYGNLSAADIKVIALAYQLEKQHVGTEHIKTVPQKNTEWNVTRRNLEKPTEIAGFYLAPKKTSSSRTTSECAGNVESLDVSTGDVVPVSDEQTDGESTAGSEVCDSVARLADASGDQGDQSLESQIKCIHIEVKDPSTVNTVCEQTSENSSSNKLCQEGDLLPSNLIEEGEDSDEEDEDEDDEDGWITPSNIVDLKKTMGVEEAQKADVIVGCLTTDFAMQNVLIQMGLNVISVDGMLIKKAKSYVLRCYACFKITSNMSNTFCPHCGNKTLKRISMNLDEDGTVRYFISARRPISTRGSKFSLPTPKGGKHATNPILVADQPMAEQRLSRKNQQNMSALDPDYVTGMSPFTINDVTSKSAMLGVHGNKGCQYWNKRNPNEVGKKGTRRK